MKLCSFTIENYRSIKKASKIEISNLTTIIGQNNEGKSNILKALNTAFSIINKRRLITNSRFKIAVRDRMLYEWERDFPVDLQDSKGKGMTSFGLTFSLDEKERDELCKTLGFYHLDEILSIKIEIGIQEKPAIICLQKELVNYTEKVVNFIALRITFNYIPAVRTDSDAMEIVQSMVSSELRILENNEKYKKALETIEKLRMPLMKSVSKNIKSSLQEFLPNIKDVTIEYGDYVKRRPLLRENVEIVVDDGVPTNLEYKGDGVKSLVTMGLLKNRRQTELPSIIAIEEPESHLHPAAISRLKNIIEDLSRTSQIIVSSHNPLLVNRHGSGSNILVESGEAFFNPGIRKIRESLGIKVSDNLVDAENVILVEGETDRIILTSFIKAYFPKLYKEVEKNTVALHKTLGIKYLETSLKTFSSLVCRVYVITDADKSAQNVLEKVLGDGLLSKTDYCSLLCQGKKEAEIEDLFDASCYLDLINKRYSVNLLPKNLNGNMKWSEKMERILTGKGKLFNKDELANIKEIVAERIAKNVKKAYDKQRCPALYDFLKCVERQVLHSSH